MARSLSEPQLPVFTSKHKKPISLKVTVTYLFFCFKKQLALSLYEEITYLSESLNLHELLKQNTNCAYLLDLTWLSHIQMS